MFDVVEYTESLESFVDQFGLESILSRLSTIASNKANQLMDSRHGLGYPDNSIEWDSAASKLISVADALPDICR